MTYHLLLATKGIGPLLFQLPRGSRENWWRTSKFPAHKSAARATVSRAIFHAHACSALQRNWALLVLFRRLPLRLGLSRAKKACSALKYIGGERRLFCGCSKTCLTSSGGKCIGAPPLKSGKLSKDYLSPPPVRTCSHGSIWTSWVWSSWLHPPGKGQRGGIHGQPQVAVWEGKGKGLLLLIILQK